MSLSARRAWIEISDKKKFGLRTTESLSARRAWIEIFRRRCFRLRRLVALRKESVDRNLDTVQIVIIVMQSLSARRAWIEIPHTLHDFHVAKCRSPQGERG